MKRFLMILVWTSAALFGSGFILATLIGFSFGVAVFFLPAFHYNPHGFLATHRSFIQGGFFIFCLVFALGAFVQGLRGRLPGTKKPPLAIEQ